MNWAEEELLSDLDDQIKSGDILVEDKSDRYFSKLEASFSLDGSKIDWKQVPGAIFANADRDHFPDGCLKFFEQMCEQNRLKGKCIYVNDGAIECALIMPVAILASCLKSIVEYPEHHYVIAEDFSWVMAFTMEGHMDFGFKPGSRLLTGE
ncbi:MAG: hypothetical protein JKY49_16835 [Cohaesibacteraceae bacterium]|nr:hypothetical protein [Cohaesibacteraceae bacterium]